MSSRERLIASIVQTLEGLFLLGFMRLHVCITGVLTPKLAVAVVIGTLVDIKLRMLFNRLFVSVTHLGRGWARVMCLR